MNRMGILAVARQGRVSFFDKRKFENERTCAAAGLSYALIGAIGLGAFLTLMLMLFSWRRVRNAPANHAVIATVVLSLVDALTKLVFVDFVWSLNAFDTVKLLAVVFLIAPAVIN